MSVGNGDKRKAPDFKAIQEKVSLKEKLLNPKLVAQKPLDVAFEDVVEFLEVPANNSTVDYIYGKLYTTEQEAPSEYSKRKAVITEALRHLKKIQLLSNEAKAKAQNKNLITISLPDMKIFGSLLNFVILEGFYAALPRGVGVPLERRRLNNFTENAKTAGSVQSRVKEQADGEDLLKCLVTELLDIFKAGGDVVQLMMRGSGYSDLLTGAICLAFNPSCATAGDPASLDQFKQVERLSTTYELFSIYTLLLQPYSLAWVREFASRRLSLIIVERDDGVMSLIEFVVGMREDEEINIEKTDHVSRILISKPKAMDSVQYFKSIGAQMFDLLILINRPALTSIVSHVIESIFERNQNIVVDFVFRKIWDKWNPKAVAGVGDGQVLTSEKVLNNAFNVVLSLTNKSSVDLTQVLFKSLIPSFWGYLVFSKRASREIGPVRDVFVSYFTITNDLESLDFIAKNLLLVDGDGWKFAIGDNNLVEIRSKTRSEDLSNEDFFVQIETAVETYVELLKKIDADLLRKEFSAVLKRWLKVNDAQIETLSGEDNPYLALIDLKLLEAIVQDFKEALSSSPDDMLNVVKSMLLSHKSSVGGSGSTSVPQFSTIVEQSSAHDQGDSDDEDEEDEVREVSESLKVVLELLSAILSETLPENVTPSSVALLREILGPLKRLSQSNKSAESLHQRISRLLAGGELSTAESEDALDRNTLSRAMTSLNDPLVPVRAHGLFLLRELIAKKSKVASVQLVIDLHLVQLKDPEPFVYLNVIKGLDALLSVERDRTLPVLLEIYSTPAKYTVDERLRIGEVLLRFITASNDTLAGHVALSLTAATLEIVRIPRDPQLKQDNRLRMSAMSLLGMCCRTNPLGVIDSLPDCFDCVLGVLQLETSREEAMVRRAAIVLIHDLIAGPGGMESVPESYGRRCMTTLRYIVETDTDLLIRDQAQTVLDYVAESLRLTLTAAEDPQLQRLKIV